jgi:hypothetical protein
MKAIDLSRASPSLTDVLKLAGEENVLLRTAEGREFVLAEIDDFADEVARVRGNEALTQLLRERSQDRTTFTLSEARERLQGKTKSRKRGPNRGEH